MAAWSNSADWRPRQTGWRVPAEPAAAVAWGAPCALGLVLLVAGNLADGGAPAWPQSLAQMGLLNGFAAATLIWSPLWGFPAVAGALMLRLLLIGQGWFGWASALLAGPLYGAVFLGLQPLLYRASDPAFAA